MLLWAEPFELLLMASLPETHKSAAIYDECHYQAYALIWAFTPENGGGVRIQVVAQKDGHQLWFILHQFN